MRMCGKWLAKCLEIENNANKYKWDGKAGHSLPYFSENRMYFDSKDEKTAKRVLNSSYFCSANFCFIK